MVEVSADQRLAADYSRGVVAELAPGELVLFGAMSRAWFAAPKRVQTAAGRDDALAFGMAEAGTLITPVLLAACMQVLTSLGQELCRGLAHDAAALIREQFRKLILGETTSIALSNQQIEQARQMALEAARHYRIPERKAEQIADAVAGRLRSRVS
jgi:hypothetical protein